MESLKNVKKVIGVKQSRKAIKEGLAAHVYTALNAQSHIIAPILELCAQMGVPVTKIETMEELGEACGIDVGAAVTAVLKN
jgi:large subunit ribosomal protein L7A